MRSPGRWRAAAFVAALSGAVVVAGCAGSRPSQQPTATATGPTHRQVDTGLDSCASCHARVTPQVAAEWKDGRHGMALVKCFVCHGSTGADFKARPDTSTCRSCHPAEWATTARNGATQSCFGCHPPHALHAQGKPSPHGPATAKEIRP